MKKPFFILTILLPIFLEAQVVNKIESINSNEVVIIESTLDGKKWVGLESKGCVFYDPITGQSTLYNTTNSSLKSDSIKAIAFRDIGGVMHTFIGTNKGVAYMHAGIWDTLANLPDLKVNDIAMGTNNTIFIATEDSGIVIYNSAFSFIKSVNKSSFPFMPTNTIKKLQVRDLLCNNFYCATNNGMLKFTNGFLYSINFDTIINKNNVGVLSNKIQSVYVNGPLCLNSYFLGTDLGLTDCTSGACVTKTKLDGLPSNDITVLEMDSTGTLWIGTRDSGLAFYKGGTITKLNVQNGLNSNKITSINCSSATKDCWIGTSDQGIASVSFDKKVTNKITLSVTRGLVNDIAVSTYPQPCNEQINFSLPIVFQKIQVQLFGLTGEIVKQIEVNSTSRFEMNVSDIPNGMYMYHLESESNAIARGKILIVK